MSKHGKLKHTTVLAGDTWPWSDHEDAYIVYMSDHNRVFGNGDALDIWWVDFSDGADRAGVLDDEDDR